MFSAILPSMMEHIQPSIEKDSSANSVKIESRKTVFRLPISYLEENIYPLNPTVSQDIELLGKINDLESLLESVDNTSCEVERAAEKSVSASRGIYEYLFNPQHQFALETIPLWNSHYTTDISFLKQTQDIVSQLKIYKDGMEKKKFKYNVSCDSLLEIWSSTRDDALFLEKYSYMEWSTLSYLNENPLFLQSISIANISAPVISFLLPILFLILPFIILKIQGIPIDIDTYIDVLKDIAKHHFIGKALSMNNFDAQNTAYLLFMGAFYIYSIYQNVITCFRFYRNMEQINHHLHELQFYLDYSLHSMRSFSEFIEGYDKYADFNKDLRRNFNILLDLHREIGKVKPFTPSIWKVMELGELLRGYYIIYSRDDFAEALQYSFGFEGYMNNLLGLHENITLGRISQCSFIDGDCSCNGNINTQFQDLYYAPHLAENYVSNNCDFSQNIVITGPNASGKTTFLKSALMNVIFSQQVGMGFYSGASIRPYTHIHSYLNIPDTSARDSLFQAESRRCKDIIDAINNNMDGRHFCTFDELYSGTNPDEATKAAFSFLNYLDKRENVDFILTTHYVDICERIQKSKTSRIGLCKMDVLENDENGIGKTMKYTYKLVNGISRIQGAIKVLRDMDYPDEILDGI